jgi:Fur family transcriptional regulator, ferric uptake regulator
LRRTLATRAVLGLFLANPQGTLSHAQALASLQARGLDINRVTLYRLLDRLAACGVLQRHADDGARTWRYGLADPKQARPRRRASSAMPATASSA